MTKLQQVLELTQLFHSESNQSFSAIFSAMTLKTFLQERRHIGRNIKCFLFAGKVLSIDQISILYSAGVLRTKCIQRCMSLISLLLKGENPLRNNAFHPLAMYGRRACFLKPPTSNTTSAFNQKRSLAIALTFPLSDGIINLTFKYSFFISLIFASKYNDKLQIINN